MARRSRPTSTMAELPARLADTLLVLSRGGHASLMADDRRRKRSGRGWRPEQFRAPGTNEEYALSPLGAPSLPWQQRDARRVLRDDTPVYCPGPRGVLGGRTLSGRCVAAAWRMPVRTVRAATGQVKAGVARPVPANASIAQCPGKLCLRGLCGRHPQVRRNARTTTPVAAVAWRVPVVVWTGKAGIVTTAVAASHVTATVPGSGN